MDHRQERCDLAAALRWTARHDMHEGIANHYSLAVSDDGAAFLINPCNRHWSKMRAGDMVELDAFTEPQGLHATVDKTAWAIHGALHRKVPHARCVMHLHSKYATALSALKNPELPPIDQNSMRFYNRVAIDNGYDGMGLGDEAERLAGCLGNRSMMMMGQHGVLAVAPDVAQAFDAIYHFERAARTYILALQTGQELNIADAVTAEKTALQWAEYGDAPAKHLAAIRAVLDEDEPDYLM